MEWLISANIQKYDLEKAFQDLQIVDWRQSANIKKGDIVYIYCGKPLQKILFETEVLQSNIPYASSLHNDSAYYLDKDFSLASITKSFIRLKAVRKYTDKHLSLANLLQHGLKTAPQGQMTVNPKLSKYISNQPYMNVAACNDIISGLIHDFTKKGLSAALKIDKSNCQLREEFVKRFPINQILTIPKSDFVTGNQNEYSFCNFLETKLREDGSIKGSFASGKFGFYYNKSQEKYIWLDKRFGTDEDIAYAKLLGEISALLTVGKEKDYASIAEIKLSPLFKNKILYTYYPDDYICVFSTEHVEHFLNKFNIPYDTKCSIEHKRDLLLQYKNANAQTKDWSNYVFSNFLYTKLSPKSLEHIVTERNLEQCLNDSDDDVNACYVQEMKLVKHRKTSQKNLKELKAIYKGSCQLCGKNPSLEFGVDIIEGHHIEYFSKTQNNLRNNLLLVCPNCHSLIHKCNPSFDYESMNYIFEDNKIVPLKFNSHLKKD